MLRFAIFLLLLSSVGCASKPMDRDDAEVTLFGPQRMRLHPIFTQVKDWTGDNVPDGVDAEVEFQDQFDDPTRAAGKMLFELFYYRPGYPDPRGERVANPWVGELVTLQQQRDHWNRTSRTYGFQLAMPSISATRGYVLTATFEHGDGRRFFGHVMLNSPQTEEPKRKSAPALPLPTTRPGVEAGTGK